MSYASMPMNAERTLDRRIGCMAASAIKEMLSTTQRRDAVSYIARCWSIQTPPLSVAFPSNNSHKVGDAMTTLDVERFFPWMRRVWAIPSLLQYLQERTRVISEHTKQHLTTSFSYYTGPSLKGGHYRESGALPGHMETLFKDEKVTHRPSRR